MTTIDIAGIQSQPAPETRDVIYLDVKDYNGNNYNWLIYSNPGVDIVGFVANNESYILAQIDAKEAEWNALDPKTRTFTNPLTQEEITVDILKEEIVKPDFPDYVALRRLAYPTVGDQLGALLNPNASPSLSEIQEAINNVKSSIKPIVPKPPSPYDVYTEMNRRLDDGFDYNFNDERGIHRIGTSDSDMKGWNEVTTWAILQMIQAIQTQTSPTATLNIRTDTGPTTVNPIEWITVLAAATAFRQPIWNAGFTLAAMNPIPSDYTSDSHWTG